MKKRIAIILVALVVFGSYLALGRFTAIVPSVGAQLATYSDTCVLSASDIYFRSNVNVLDGKEGWIITGVDGGCAEKIIGGNGKIPSESVKDGDKSAEKDFTISTLNRKGWWEYDTNKKDDFVYPQYYIYDCGLNQFGIPSCEDVKKKCKDKDPIYMKKYGGLTEMKVACFWEGEDKGDKYNIGTGSERFEMDVKSCTGSQCTSTETVSDTDKSAVLDLYGDKKAYFKVVGSVDLAENPKPTNYYVLGWDDPLKGGYKLIPKSNWNDYKDKMSEPYLSNCMSDVEYPTDRDIVKGCANDMRNAYFDATKDKESEYENNNLGWDLRIDGDSVSVYGGEDAFVKPLFKIMATVGWIGVEVKSSNPEIVYTSSSKVKPSADGLVTVDVKNKADVYGSVEVGVNCDYPISGDSRTKNIPAGKVERYNIPIDTGSDDEGTYTCDIVAQDVEIGSRKDTATVEVELEANGNGGNCRPLSHHKKCFGNDVYWYDACDNRRSIAEKCLSNELCRSGECKGEPEPDHVNWKLIGIIGVIAALGGYVGYQKYQGKW